MVGIIRHIPGGKRTLHGAAVPINQYGEFCESLPAEFQCRKPGKPAGHIAEILPFEKRAPVEVRAPGPIKINVSASVDARFCKRIPKFPVCGVDFRQMSILRCRTADAADQHCGWLFRQFHGRQRMEHKRISVDLLARAVQGQERFARFSAAPRLRGDGHE